MVPGEVDLPIKVGSQIFESVFYVMDIWPSYSYLLGRPWIHGAGAVTSTLHQKLKYPMKGKIVTVCEEEEYIVIHINSLWYVEMDGEFIETPYQNFEAISPAAIKDVSAIPKTTRVPHKMDSLKDAKDIIE